MGVIFSFFADFFHKKPNYPESIQKKLHEHYTKIHQHESAIKIHKKAINQIKLEYEQGHI